jgi:hypothetical protein
LPRASVRGSYQASTPLLSWRTRGWASPRTSYRKSSSRSSRRRIPARARGSAPPRCTASSSRAGDTCGWRGGRRQSIHRAPAALRGPGWRCASRGDGDSATGKGGDPRRRRRSSRASGRAPHARVARLHGVRGGQRRGGTRHPGYLTAADRPHTHRRRHAGRPRTPPGRMRHGGRSGTSRALHDRIHGRQRLAARAHARHGAAPEAIHDRGLGRAVRDILDDH